MNGLRNLGRIAWWGNGARAAPQGGDLLAWLRENDSSARAELVEQYHRSVFHMAYRLTRNRADAEDITQEVFLKALRSLSSLRQATSVKTWLFKIAVNLSIDRWRSVKAAPELPAASVESHGPAACLEQKERQERLQQAILELHDKQRATLVLRIFHQLSFREIAEVMGSPIGTVKANYHHAIVRLRSLLGKSLTSH